MQLTASDISIIRNLTQGQTQITLSADRYSAWTRQKTTLFSGHYLRNRSTLDIGVLGYIGILSHKEHPPEVLHIPPGTPVYDEKSCSRGFPYSLYMVCTAYILGVQSTPFTRIGTGISDITSDPHSIKPDKAWRLLDAANQSTASKVYVYLYEYTTHHAGKLQVHFLMRSLDFLIHLILPPAPWSCSQLSLTERSTRNLQGGKRWATHKANNLTAICELLVQKMWETPLSVTAIALPLF
jgi:hypothetical protein